MGHKTVCTHFIKINRFRVTGQLKNSNFGRKSLITSKKNFIGSWDISQTKDREILHKKKFG